MASKGKTKAQAADADSNFGFKTTAEFKVPGVLIDQIVGQDEAVHVIKKAAKQRRHVLLIGEPGTGKSLMGMAMAELLPKEKLVSILAFSNPNDENQPLIRIVPSSRGKDIVTSARLEAGKMSKHVNVIMMILLIASMIVPWWAFNHYTAISPILGGIMFLTFSLFGFASLLSFILFLNLGRKLKNIVNIPKIIVNNFEQKTAPFYDATGAHAGALLGDVLHDPFQSFISSKIYVREHMSGDFAVKSFDEAISELFTNHYDDVIKSDDGYEALHIPKNTLFTFGETDGAVSPVEVLSVNRYDYDGELIKLRTSEGDDIAVTPEHKITVLKNNKLEYIEARELKQGDIVATQTDFIIIDEEDVINTYDAHQQEQCRLYYQYREIKASHPEWGYKRIAKAINQPIGKTRWWHEGKHIPVPLQTVNWLEGRGLMPLAATNQKLPLLAKVLGATFGDGGIFNNLNGIFLSSSEREAVEEFGKDLEGIFNLKTDENSRIIEGGVYGHSWCYQNTNRNIIRFFLAIGAPKGNKTDIELKIPKWILLNQELEKNFYGSFLGGELGSPTQHIEKNRLTGIGVGIVGKPEFENNRIEFLAEVSNYLSRAGISTGSIYKGKVKESRNSIYRLLISTLFDNVLKFMIEIKLNYCKYKVDRLYLALGKWADWKQKKYYELIERGYGAEHAMKTLNLTPNSLYLLLNHFGPKKEEAVAV